MNKTAINRYSLNKIAEMNEEIPAKLELIKRCGGKPYEYREFTYRQGIRHTIHRVACVGGYCECGRAECGGRLATHPFQLHPHEIESRGRGGKLSLENSIMILDPCHDILQNNLPKWSGGLK